MSTKQNHSAAPSAEIHDKPLPGYWENAEGHFIPESKVKPIDKLRSQLVADLITDAKSMAEQLARFKASAFGNIAAFVQLSFEQYDLKVGGNKGNITLTSYDGRFKVVRQIADTIVFDERLQAAKKLIDDCIARWAANSVDEIKALINDAFQVNKEGRINTGRVLGLRRLDIDDPSWKKAMTAISDSIQVSKSKPYVRFYERDEATGEYRPISLDLATAA